MTAILGVRIYAVRRGYIGSVRDEISIRYLTEPEINDDNSVQYAYMNRFVYNEIRPSDQKCVRRIRKLIYPRQLYPKFTYTARYLQIS